jgi:hypothetical protein
MVAIKHLTSFNSQIFDLNQINVVSLYYQISNNAFD